MGAQCVDPAEMWFASEEQTPSCPHDAVVRFLPPEWIDQATQPANLCQMHADLYQARLHGPVEPVEL